MPAAKSQSSVPIRKMRAGRRFLNRPLVSGLQKQNAKLSKLQEKAVSDADTLSSVQAALHEVAAQLTGVKDFSSILHNSLTIERLLPKSRKVEKLFDNWADVIVIKLPKANTKGKRATALKQATLKMQKLESELERIALTSFMKAQDLETQLHGEAQARVDAYFDEQQVDLPNVIEAEEELETVKRPEFGKRFTEKNFPLHLKGEHSVSEALAILQIRGVKYMANLLKTGG